MIPFLGSIVGAFGGEIVDKILGRVTGLFDSYFKKQVSFEELRTGVQRELVGAVKEVEAAHADSIAKTYESFQQTLRVSPMVQMVWVVVVLSQLVVLLWHQMGIPIFSYMSGEKFPSSGSTVEWAYALIGFMFGAGAMLLRTGPGSGMLDRLRGMIK